VRAVQIVSPAEFEGYVADALDTLPPELASHFSNVVVVVEDEHPE
jgi:predicted Zn-dependent protease with MMP-like domain